MKETHETLWILLLAEPSIEGCADACHTPSIRGWGSWRPLDPHWEGRVGVMCNEHLGRVLSWGL